MAACGGLLLGTLLVGLAIVGGVAGWRQPSAPFVASDPMNAGRDFVGRHPGSSGR